jgi:hypothetical protein
VDISFGLADFSTGHTSYVVTTQQKRKSGWMQLENIRSALDILD